ncbi:MAG TPA: DNA primase, partial [Candidatus Nanopelagicales bacterium]|nr:DNA primase [Candidatus Nanopelagicales bacterium]
SRGFYYCFGCGEGGDVLTFVQKMEHATFVEAVEKLAARFGVTLRYEEGGAAPIRPQGQRSRLVAAHQAAAEFYVAALASPDGRIGRDFLIGRGFDAAAAERFGVGYAPRGWESLTTHLRGRGFSDAELTRSGLAVQGNRGSYDRFRGRLVWPIRDLTGDVIGFGARKLHDDDDGPKYLNTPETAIYKKSQVLYGLDLARRDIARSQQAVVVEGYTDVMAAHLAGVTTAIATCGTAFGGEHVRVLRRLLADNDVFTGHVVFTFDGDAAGQKAAERAFDEDQKFLAQTYVAVQPDGLDPCDLRLAQGDEAVRELVQNRVPLFEFAIRAALSRLDLTTAEGRVAGLREAAPVVARIRDRALRPEYERLLSGWLGMEPRAVAQAVAGASRTAPAAPRPESAPVTDGEPRLPRPDPRDKVAAIEREALKVVLQVPQLAGSWAGALEPAGFTAPAYRAGFEAVVAAGGADAGLTDRAWVDAVLASAPNEAVRQVVLELSVDPLPKEVPDERFAVSVVARLLEVDASRRITDLKAALAQGAPTDPSYAQQFADLLALEAYRRDLRVQVAGGPEPA